MRDLTKHNAQGESMVSKVGRLKGKVAFITGGSGGQGLVEAQLFAEEGARVILADIVDAPGKAMAARINKQGGRAIYVNMDVTKIAQWHKTINKIKRKFGALHILVNNAGVINRTGIMDIPMPEWHQVLDTNLTGPLLGMRAAAPLIRDSGGGAIVNISSSAALVAHAGIAYVASKWGLRGITKTAAMEFIDWRIRANSVHPHQVTNTRMAENSAPGYREANERVMPFGRPAIPEEIAQAVLFLASDESSYLTGSEIVVDGGYTSFALSRLRKQLQTEYADRGAGSRRKRS